MRLLCGVYLLLSVAYAADVRIHFIHHRETNASSLIAYSTSGDLITRICGTTIKAKESVDFSNINENGVGNFTVGSTSFFVHSDPKYSGGPSCSTDFDHAYTAIQCSGVKWDLEGVVKQDPKSCFFGNLAGGGFEECQTDTRYHKLHRRCGEREPRLDGDGWPHQRYYYQQLSLDIAAKPRAALLLHPTRRVSARVGVRLPTFRFGSREATLYQSPGALGLHMAAMAARETKSVSGTGLRTLPIQFGSPGDLARRICMAHKLLSLPQTRTMKAGAFSVRLERIACIRAPCIGTAMGKGLRSLPTVDLQSSQSWTPRTTS